MPLPIQHGRIPLTGMPDEFRKQSWVVEFYAWWKDNATKAYAQELTERTITSETPERPLDIVNHQNKAATNSSGNRH